MKSVSMTRSQGQVYSVGNYLMTGKVLGKGHFARVEEATHRVIGKKVSVIQTVSLQLKIFDKREMVIFCLNLAVTMALNIMTTYIHRAHDIIPRNGGGQNRGISRAKWSLLPITLR